MFDSVNLKKSFWGPAFYDALDRMIEPGCLLAYAVRSGNSGEMTFAIAGEVDLERKQLEVWRMSNGTPKKSRWNFGSRMCIVYTDAQMLSMNGCAFWNEWKPCIDAAKGKISPVYK